MHDDDNDLSFDFTVLIADYLASTNVLDRTVAALGKFCAAIPFKLAGWLGPALKTPDNSNAPRVIPGEPGPWTGVIFIEHDEPRYWVFAKASGPTTRRPIGPQPDRFGPSYDDRSGRPPGAFRAPTVWPEQEEPDWYGPPMEPTSWRGGP